MQEADQQQSDMNGIHWVYSRDEWRRFRLWNDRNAGWWPFLKGFWARLRAGRIPEVKLMPDRLHIGDRIHALGPGGKQLKRVQILEAGEQNVLSLTCAHHTGTDEEISILVPKGKLREAVALETYWHDHLLTDPPGLQRSVQQYPAL
jgi:hypothetical protein